MKNIAANTLLVVFSLIVSLVALELYLRHEGTYNDLVKPNLVASQALWEYAGSVTQKASHPDLKEEDILLEFDQDGVRNHSAARTKLKTNIVAFFGDSFVENRRIDDRFTFSSILDQELSEFGYSVANFGVDGYGLDQAYIRYNKYKGFDIRHVFYVFCSNDLRNLYETGLTEIVNDEVRIREPQPNPVLKALGRARMTYFFLESYFRVQELLRRNPGPEAVAPNPKELPIKLSRRLSAEQSAQNKRYHDQFADSIVSDLLSERPNTETMTLANRFKKLLIKWNEEAMKDNRKLKIIVLPRELDDSVGRKLFEEFPIPQIYLHDYFDSYEKYRFKNDGHWNEYGNLKAADALLQARFLDDFQVPNTLREPDYIQRTKMIADYYDSVRRQHLSQ